MADGVEGSLQALPIDIAYNKLADWLVDRKKIPIDWRKKLASVRLKISAALSTLMRELDPSFRELTIENTGYWEAKHVRDVLLSKMPEARSLFGRPTGAAGEWQAIVSGYEKDFIFLGEAAQIMVQSTNYDIPYQKRQIAKLQQQLADLDHKESDAKRNVVQSAANYQQACQELGIEGVNVRMELRDLGKTLPKIFSDVVDGLCSELVGSALEFYQAFSAYTCEVPQDKSRTVLPTLTGLRLHPPDGDATFSQQPMEPHHEGEGMLGSENDARNTEIDWSIEREVAGGGADGEGDIDWDVGTLEDINPSDDSIQQSDGLDAGTKESNDGSADAVAAVSGTVAEEMQGASVISGDVDLSTEIDWDIGVEEDGILLTTNDDGPQITSQPEHKDGVKERDCDGEKVAQISWFATAQNRSNLLDDLFELKVFLQQRLQESVSEASTALQMVAPSSIPQHGSESLTAMAASVAETLKLITNHKTRDLIRIATSSRYLDRLEDSFKQKKQIESNLHRSIGDLKLKRIELLNSQASLWPTQEAVITRTKAVKKLVEDVLPTHYNGRKVNIIGEINTLLG